jgi:hypothetical protein
MNLLGKWWIIAMPDYEEDYPDMVGLACIHFGETSGEFASGCVTGQIHGGVDADATAIEFSWTGNNEMDEASGDGSVELQPDGTLSGQIDFHNGDEIYFTASRWATSSTAC